MAADLLQREWRPDWPCPVGALLVQHRRGVQDPTWRREGNTWWRATRSPQGPATVRVSLSSGRVCASAWGDGASWVLDSLPALLGAEDDLDGFDPADPLVLRAWRAAPHWRFSRTGNVMESLVPSVIEQKVTAVEAFAAFRRLVLAHGEHAPGPADGPPLWLPPSTRALASIPSWEWTRLGIDVGRARPLAAVARVGDSLARFSDASGERLERALTSIAGIGRWTSAEVRARALGDSDAVSYGDYHLAADIGWAVRGSAFTDAELEEWLAPWRGHRGRVVALVRAFAGRRPRRGPRMAPRTHLPVRRDLRAGGGEGRGRTR